ncbi:NDR1/HIN1-like protein 26 [Bienertia sinuspersici]
MVRHRQAPRPAFESQPKTHPLIWCAAIICTLITIIVIITGMVVFIGYLVIRPKMPYVSVQYAHLDRFDYTQAGVLNTEITILFKAQNDNLQAHASFSDFIYYLNFHGMKIARLKNMPFEVDKNSSKLFNYDVQSFSIPLDPDHMAMVDRSLKINKISFDLWGHTRTRWRVGPFKSVKFWLRLNCQLHFQVGGNSIGSHCSSKSK